MPDTPRNCASPYAGSTSRFSDRNPFTVEFNHLIVTLIGPLSHARGPTAIPRPVAAFVVDALDSVLWRWTWSHVGGKSGEVLPTVADRDAARAIMFVSWIGGILTSLPHIDPNRPDAAFGLSMCDVISLGVSPLPASATGRMTILDSAESHSRFIAAVATKDA